MFDNEDDLDDDASEHLLRSWKIRSLLSQSMQIKLDFTNTDKIGLSIFEKD